MRARFRLSDLIPAELTVEAVRHRPDMIVVVAYGKSRDAVLHTRSNLCNPLIKPLQRPAVHCDVAGLKMFSVRIRPIIDDGGVLVESGFVAEEAH